MSPRKYGEHSGKLRGAKSTSRRAADRRRHGTAKDMEQTQRRGSNGNTSKYRAPRDLRPDLSPYLE